MQNISPLIARFQHFVPIPSFDFFSTKSICADVGLSILWFFSQFLCSRYWKSRMHLKEISVLRCFDSSPSLCSHPQSVHRCNRSVSAPSSIRASPLPRAHCSTAPISKHHFPSFALFFQLEDSVGEIMRKLRRFFLSRSPARVWLENEQSFSFYFLIRPSICRERCQNFCCHPSKFVNISPAADEFYTRLQAPFSRCQWNFRRKWVVKLCNKRKRNRFDWWCNFSFQVSEPLNGIGRVSGCCPSVCTRSRGTDQTGRRLRQRHFRKCVRFHTLILQ